MDTLEEKSLFGIRAAVAALPCKECGSATRWRLVAASGWPEHQKGPDEPFCPACVWAEMTSRPAETHESWGIPPWLGWSLGCRIDERMFWGEGEEPMVEAANEVEFLVKSHGRGLVWQGRHIVINSDRGGTLCLEKKEG